jgi:hypothetical protein
MEVTGELELELELGLYRSEDRNQIDVISNNEAEIAIERSLVVDLMTRRRDDLLNVDDYRGVDSYTLIPSMSALTSTSTSVTKDGPYI